MLASVAIIQAGLIMQAQLMVTQAAREGARQATTADSDGEVVTAAQRAASTLDPSRLAVAISAPGGWKTGEPVTVDTSYDVPLFASILNRIMPSACTVKAKTTMRIEKER